MYIHPKNITLLFLDSQVNKLISNFHSQVMEDPKLRLKTKSYEDAKPLTGRLIVKTNRIAVNMK